MSSNINGSHTRDDALMDSLLAWRMLKPNGTIIWDDYIWQFGKLPAEERPKDAIDPGCVKTLRLM